LLTLVGFGLRDHRGLSLRALEVCREADRIFLENYTSPVDVEIEEFETTLGKPVTQVQRRDLEEVEQIIEESRDKEVVLLTPGDPLIATTHVTLLLRARRLGIQTGVIHAASIYSAGLGESGLHPYKFGRFVTLTSGRDFTPYSVYECVRENLERGCHTLLLLQDDPETEERVTPSEALRLLLDMEEERGGGVVAEDSLVVVLSGVGSPEGDVFAGSLREARKHGFRDLPSALVIPAELHFTEVEVIQSIREDGSYV
jgi:diphthine synthase